MCLAAAVRCATIGQILSPKHLGLKRLFLLCLAAAVR